MINRFFFIKLFCLISIFVSCDNKPDLNSSEIVNYLDEIEVAIGLNSQKEADYLKRLSIIRNHLVEKNLYVKYPIMFFDKPQVSVDSTYCALWTMASYNKKALPVALIKSENGILVGDTIKFNLECGCFPVKLNNVVKGENKYIGYIFDEGMQYIFEGFFEGY